MTAAELSDETLREGDAGLARRLAAVRQQVVAESWDVDRVAAFFDLAPASVRRAATEGALYSFTSGIGEELWFPAWQFTETGLLPGLPEIVRELPRSYHPVTVRDLMTESDEALEEHSPVQWPTEGHALASVMEINKGWNRE